jgi:hypothetical protein
VVCRQADVNSVPKPGIGGSIPPGDNPIESVTCANELPTRRVGICSNPPDSARRRYPAAKRYEFFHGSDGRTRITPIYTKRVGSRGRKRLDAKDRELALIKASLSL